MPDLALFQGMMSSLKLAADIAIGLNKLNTAAEVNAKAIELQQIILNAQSSAFNAQTEQATMVQEINTLKEEIARVKAWEAEKQRYQLIQVDGGAYAYSLKADSKGTEPPHWICAKCYEDGKRSILQHNGVMFIRDSKAKCPVCKTDISESGRCRQIQYAE